MPALTVTVGIPLDWAAAIAAPMAVYWPLPSAATVTAGRLLVVDVVKGIDATKDDDDNDDSDEDKVVENVTRLESEGVAVVCGTESVSREELEVIEALADICPEEDPVELELVTDSSNDWLLARVLVDCSKLVEVDCD